MIEVATRLSVGLLMIRLGVEGEVFGVQIFSLISVGASLIVLVILFVLVSGYKAVKPDD